jgi:hypothetical protein
MIEVGGVMVKNKTDITDELKCYEFSWEGRKQDLSSDNGNDFQLNLSGKYDYNNPNQTSRRHVFEDVYGTKFTIEISDEKVTQSGEGSGVSLTNNTQLFAEVSQDLQVPDFQRVKLNTLTADFYDLHLIGELEFVLQPGFNIDRLYNPKCVIKHNRSGMNNDQDSAGITLYRGRIYLNDDQDEPSLVVGVNSTEFANENSLTDTILSAEDDQKNSTSIMLALNNWVLQDEDLKRWLLTIDANTTKTLTIKTEISCKYIAGITAAENNPSREDTRDFLSYSQNDQFTLRITNVNSNPVNNPGVKFFSNFNKSDYISMAALTVSVGVTLVYLKNKL